MGPYIGSALLGAIAAVLAWVATSFVGTPVRKFFYLRGEVIGRLTALANVRARYKQQHSTDDVEFIISTKDELFFSDRDAARLEEAQRVLRDLASQMRAFAFNEHLAMRLILQLKYNPRAASDGLIGLSNTYDTYGEDKSYYRRMVETALRVGQM
jgi:hypothetical protein